MNCLNPHKLVISGGAAKLQTNPAEQLQNQGLARLSYLEQKYADEVKQDHSQRLVTSDESESS